MRYDTRSIPLVVTLPVQVARHRHCGGRAAAAASHQMQHLTSTTFTVEIQMVHCTRGKHKPLQFYSQEERPEVTGCAT